MPDDSINTIQDLAEYFEASDASLGSIQARVYKMTACGAWIALRDPYGNWHPSSESQFEGPIAAIQFGSIVEGSDAEVTGDVLELPTNPREILTQLDGVEEQAREYWEEANTPQGEERVRIIAGLAEAYAREGEIEFDAITAAEISEGDDNGAYVRAWVWVSFEGTDLDKHLDDIED